MWGPISANRDATASVPQRAGMVLATHGMTDPGQKLVDVAGHRRQFPLQVPPLPPERLDLGEEVLDGVGRQRRRHRQASPQPYEVLVWHDRSIEQVFEWTASGAMPPRAALLPSPGVQLRS